MRKKNIFGLLILSAFIIAGCTSQKKLTYFNNINAKSADSINSVVRFLHEVKIVSGDKLGISVSARDPKAVATYNLPFVSYLSPGSDQIYAAQTLQPYVVDTEGNINFPEFGKINVGGLTRNEAVNLIAQKITPYVQNPIVNLQFLNFKVTVLGEVTRPGQYAVVSERTTILDALGLAGDLTAYGTRNDILVMRENNGKIEFGKVNLNDESVFSSPYYYVRQNDAIYVKPNSVKSTSISSQNLPLYLSSISTLATLVTLTYSISQANKKSNNP